MNPIRFVNKAEWEWIKEHHSTEIADETDNEFYFNGLRVILRPPLPTGTLYIENKKDAQVKQRLKERLEKTLPKRVLKR